MQDKTFKISHFAGLARSMANPPINSLYECKNLVQDDIDGGLVPRLGVDAIEVETTNVDGFTQHTLDDIKARISIKGGHVYCKPFLYGGTGTDADKVIDNNEKLTDAIKWAGDGAGGTKASGWFEFSTSSTGDGAGIGTITWGARPFEFSWGSTLTAAQQLAMPGRGIVGNGTYFTTQLAVGKKITFNALDSDGVWKDKTFTVEEIVSDYFLIVKEYVSFRRFFPFIYKSFTIDKIPVGGVINGETVVIGANTYTFKDTPVGDNDVQISTIQLSTTVQNLINKINAVGTETVTASFGWSNGLARCLLEYDTVGIAGNSIALSETSTTISKSATTLLGGTVAAGLLSIKSISGSTITLNQPHPRDNGWYKYAIIRNKNAYLVASPDMHYAVVKSVSNAQEPVLTLNKDVQTGGWTVNDVIILYRSDMQAKRFDASNNVDEALSVDYDLNSPIHFAGLGGKNDLGVFGISAYNKPLWIGKINNRQYFSGANSFSFNGIYCTSLMDEFLGVTQSSQRPINLKVDAVTAGSGKMNNVFQFAYSLKYDGFNESVLNKTDVTGTVPTDTNYAAAASERNIAIFADVNASPFDNPNAESFSNNGELYDLNLPNRVAGATVTKATIKIEFPHPECINRRITDVVLYSRQLYVDFGASAAVLSKGAWRRVIVKSISDSSWKYAIAKPSTACTATKAAGGSVTAGNHYYKVTFVNPDGETDASIASNLVTTETTNLRVNLTNIPVGESSVTARKIYRTLAGGSTYYLVTTINDNTTTIYTDDAADGTLATLLVESGVFPGRYYIEIVVTADMLGGELFVDKLKYAPNDVLYKDVLVATNVNRRLFAVDTTNRQMVYYSPINDNGECQSLLPSSSFFLVNRLIGDIVKLQSINNRLLVFKKNSMFTVSVDGSPLTPRDEYISDTIGLAGFGSVINSNRLIYFVGYSGIYRSDGFKIDDKPLNTSWMSDFRGYTNAELEQSIGFYNVKTQSCYFWIKDIFWVFDTRNNLWHRESFSYTTGGVTYGIPNLVSFDGDKIVLYDKTSGQYISFPSTEYIDKYIINGAKTSVSFTSEFETNDIESDFGLDSVLHSNSGYFRGENNAGFTLQLKDGSNERASASVSANRYVFPLKSTKPMSRIKALFSATISGKLTIKEIGIQVKIAKRIGTIKTL